MGNMARSTQTRRHNDRNRDGAGRDGADREIVTLDDLAPRHQVVGGSARRVFGADFTPSQENTMAAKKDLPASKPVKGGGTMSKLSANDNMTLVRGAKPSKKDLPAGKDVKAGKKIR